MMFEPKVGTKPRMTTLFDVFDALDGFFDVFDVGDTNNCSEKRILTLD